jgi:hypothetical protein
VSDGLGAIRRFVSRHSLHRHGAVNAQELYDLLNVARVNLSDQTLGCSYWSRVEPMRNHQVIVNGRLSAHTQNAVVGHELAHHLLRHPNGIYLCQHGAWAYRRCERAAEAGSAVLWVSRRYAAQLIGEGATLSDLEEVFSVPGQLIELRLSLAP